MNDCDHQNICDIREVVEKIYQSESRRVLATLIRLLGDFDSAEEALHNAFASAVEQWSRDGVPENPRAWLVSAGRFKAIDSIRRRSKFHASQADVVRRQDSVAEFNAARADEEIEDDRLRLIFTCCHPAIDPSVQVALTLREVCGLTTEEIASAFLVAPATMAQRIVRGKSKIRDAGIPYVIPSAEELSERLDSVLKVIYLVFNEGYSASSGVAVTRSDLTGEAIRLGRLICELQPDAEAFGLLALMMLHESRRAARTAENGDIILLEDQDRAMWNRELINEAIPLIHLAIGSGAVGPYTIQAAISAVHAESPRAADTDWQRIVEWYDLLMQAAPSSVVELNRAVAVAMRDGPDAGLVLIEPLINCSELSNHHLLYAAKADLLRRLGNKREAAAAYHQALSLAKQEPERRYLEGRLREVA